MRKLFTVFMALVLSLAYSSPVLAQSATPVAMGPSLSSVTDGQATSLRTDLFGRLYVNVHNIVTTTPTSGMQGTQGIMSATTAVASNLVVNGSNANLLYLNVVSGASAGYVMVFNATSAPADGAVTPTLCYTLAANSTLTITYESTAQPYFGTGIVVVFSTTGCFTKTASATAFISAVSNDGMCVRRPHLTR
jgi:hypothetical protein